VTRNVRHVDIGFLSGAQFKLIEFLFNTKRRSRDSIEIPRQLLEFHSIYCLTSRFTSSSPTKSKDQVPPSQRIKSHRQVPPSQTTKSHNQVPQSSPTSKSHIQVPPSQRIKSHNQVPQSSPTIKSHIQVPPSQRIKSHRQVPPSQTTKSHNQLPFKIPFNLLSDESISAFRNFKL
jgi:hypothetical protein